MIELLFLLLPLAFYSGWRASGKSLKKKAPEKRPLSDNFVKGVNYLLDEQPDKALDVFLNRPEVDEYTAETYLLLGNLFRNRGEVDRALSVHQNLIGRASLSREQKAITMLALGKDFLSAGMMDRAESVFSELLQSNPNDVEARVALREIFEQTQEWEKAIEVTRLVQSEDVSHLIANYHCELAELALQKGHIQEANECLKSASEAAPKANRIKVLQADIALLQQEYSIASERYLDVATAAPQLLALIYPSMTQAYSEAGIIDELQDQLFGLFETSSDVKVLEFALRLSVEREPTPNVLEKLPDVLNKRQLNVRAIGKAVKVYQGQSTDVESLQLVDNALTNYLSSQPGFQCLNCGYKMHDFLWRCPACNKWDNVAHV
ncbi:tetratricopeptide repeat protein [Leucothrix sargassi]|nr:tetratricopeptide repeat protein [Leucothrix sargassi]